MITVKHVRGVGNAGSVESINTFSSTGDAREFAHDVLDEILDAVASGAGADNGLIRIWDDETNGALINDLWSWEH